MLLCSDLQGLTLDAECVCFLYYRPFFWDSREHSQHAFPPLKSLGQRMGIR